MILREDKYVPVLSWRQGEYMALDLLMPSVKEKIIPLILIPRIEFDFEAWKNKKTVDEHVQPFIARYKKRWDNRPAWLGLHNTIAAGRMSDGSHVFDYILDGLRSNHAHAVPVLTLESDTDAIAATARAIGRDQYGAGLRIRLENLMSESIEDESVRLAKELSLPLEEIDLIVDLQTPNFEPYQDFANALIARTKSLRILSKYRNLVLISSAIPSSFRDIEKGIDEIPRHDWLFYKVYFDSLPRGMRRPVYGDYTVIHPKFKILDMRKIKPLGKIVYTTPKTWAICKGDSFYDHPEQMISHCRTIMNNPKFQFRGAGFSYGDNFIAEYSSGMVNKTNLTRWKTVAINHHISTVVDQLSNTFDSP